MAKIAHNGQVLINVFVAFWADTVLKNFRDLCIEIFYELATRAQFATKIETLCNQNRDPKRQIGTQIDKCIYFYEIVT